MTSYFGDPELRERIAALGTEISPSAQEGSSALFAPRHPSGLRHEVVRDMRYGPHARHRLDLHVPASRPARTAPVLLFVHGGGYTGGDKVRPGSPFYDNIGRWGTDCGLVVATMTYRLAPEHRFPSGAEDVAAALRWLHQRVGEWGGEPSSVVVMGHSAGASHVACCLAGRGSEESSVLPVAGGILSSGIYEPSRYVAESPTSGCATYFGTAPSTLARGTALDGLAECGVPLLVSVAERDPSAIQRQMWRLVSSCLAANDRLPAIVQVPEHNHFTVMQHIGTEETWFSDRLRWFVESVRTHTPASGQRS